MKRQWAEHVEKGKLEVFLDYCNSNSLANGGSVFPHENIYKYTWRSSDGCTTNQIDHIAIIRRYRRSLFDVMVFRSADIGSDHEMLIAKVQLKLKQSKYCKYYS